MVAGWLRFGVATIFGARVGVGLANTKNGTISNGTLDFSA
jgi:hypothetical protein